MCEVANILAAIIKECEKKNRSHIENLFTGINETSVNNSRASAHKIVRFLSFYFLSAPSASISINLMSSVKNSCSPEVKRA